jgi:ferredoxin
LLCTGFEGAAALLITYGQVTNPTEILPECYETVLFEHSTKNAKELSNKSFTYHQITVIKLFYKGCNSCGVCVCVCVIT